MVCRGQARALISFEGKSHSVLPRYACNAEMLDSKRPSHDRRNKNHHSLKKIERRSNTSASPPSCDRLLRISNNELEARVPLLALTQQRCVIEYRSTNVTIKHDTHFIAACIPPSSYFRNHLRDPFVSGGRGIFHHLC